MDKIIDCNYVTILYILIVILLSVELALMGDLSQTDCCGPALYGLK